MVVPTGHPIYGTSFVALEANWIIQGLGSVIGGVSVSNHSFVAIVPYLSNYIVTFDWLTHDHNYQFFQYSGPPMNLFIGSVDSFGTIYVNLQPFGTTFGWAGIPYSMNYHRISQVGVTRVPRSTPSVFEFYTLQLPAYIVQDPLIVRYDPYQWIGSEAIVAWATLEDALKENYDELMTAKDYIGMELIALPTSPKSGLVDVWIVDRGWIEGLQSVYRKNPCKGTFWFWAWTRLEKQFHLFDDSRYQFFDPIIKPGGKVFAIGLFHAGSVGVQATAERHRYPQPGDPGYIRSVTCNPAPFDVIEWFDVTVFAAGYFYQHKGSYVFETSYGAVIPPCYTIEYYGSQVILSVYLATNIPSGSVLIHQAVLAYPKRVQFHPESYSNLLTVLIDWLYYAANRDRFILVSDYSDPLTITPEDGRSESLAVFTACDVKSYKPFGGEVTDETEDGWEVRFKYTSLHGYTYEAVYFKRRDGALRFNGCDPLVIVPLSGGLRWLVPMLTDFDTLWCMQSGADEPWDFVYPVNISLSYNGVPLPRTIVDPLPVYTDLPDNRVIDVERPHEFFYEDIFVLTNPKFPDIPATIVGSVIANYWDVPNGDYVLRVTTPLAFTYIPAFAGSWKYPTPLYNAEGNDPFNILPNLRRTIERRFKREVYHSNFLSDVHIRIQTRVFREFVECVITKPTFFHEHRTGRDPGEWFGGTYPFIWLIPVVADHRAINEFLWFHPTIDHWCLKNFASYDVRLEEAIPVVIGRTMCSVPRSVLTPIFEIFINPIVPLIARPNATYRFVRRFYDDEYLIRSIARFLDALVCISPDSSPREEITDHEFVANPAGFHAVGSALWSSIQLPGIAQPAPAPFIPGGAKITGLGSLYRWAVSEGLVVPKWFERFIERNGETGDHFLAGKLPTTIVYASYWPLDPTYLQLFSWKYIGTNPYVHVSIATNIYVVFNEIFRSGTIMWSAPLRDDYPWRGAAYNNLLSLGFTNNRSRLLFPRRGWVEELPAGKMTRIPDSLEVLALYGTSTYLDREAIFVKEIVTLGNTSVLILPRHARYDQLGLTVPYFTQDGGRCPLWMGEPIVGVDAIPFDDGRIVVYVYSVRGVYSFVLTPRGVEDWAFEPVPKWYWKLLTGQEI